MTAEHILPSCDSMRGHSPTSYCMKYDFGLESPAPNLEVVYERDLASMTALAFPLTSLYPVKAKYEASQAAQRSVMGTLNLSRALTEKILRVPHAKDVTLELHANKLVELPYGRHTPEGFPTVDTSTPKPYGDLLTLIIRERPILPRAPKITGEGVIYAIGALFAHQFDGTHPLSSKMRLRTDVDMAITTAIARLPTKLMTGNVVLKTESTKGNVQVTLPTQMIKLAEAQPPSYLERNTVDFVTSRISIKFPSIKVGVEVDGVHLGSFNTPPLYGKLDGMSGIEVLRGVYLPPNPYIL